MRSPVNENQSPNKSPTTFSRASNSKLFSSPWVAKQKQFEAASTGIRHNWQYLQNLERLNEENGENSANSSIQSPFFRNHKQLDVIDKISSKSSKISNKSSKSSWKKKSYDMYFP